MNIADYSANLRSHLRALGSGDALVRMQTEMTGRVSALLEPEFHGPPTAAELRARAIEWMRGRGLLGGK